MTNKYNALEEEADAVLVDLNSEIEELEE